MVLFVFNAIIFIFTTHQTTRDGSKTLYPLLQTLNQLVLGEELGEIVSNKYREDSSIELSDSNYDYTRIMTNELNDLFFTCPTRLMTR